MTSPALQQLIIYCLVTATWSEIEHPFETRGVCPDDVDFPTCDSIDSPVRPDCRINRGCAGKRKCCYSGCRYQCLLPLEDKTGSCPYFNAKQCVTIRPSPSTCHNDSQCQGSERCCCYNCNKRCVPTVKVKPGQCPAQPKVCPYEGEEGPERPDGKVDVDKRPLRCKTDAECPGTWKCCDYCGMTCQPPVREHIGFCPVSNEQISCVSLFEKPCCSNDEDCKLTHKCCLIGTRMECVQALKEKSGTCPPVFVKCVPINKKCGSDAQCVGNKKCCQVECRMECVDPIKSG